MPSREALFLMKRFVHIILLLALYNVCGFCLKYSLSLPAAVAAVLFLISAWGGAFVALTHVIIMILEGNKYDQTDDYLAVSDLAN